MQAAGTRAFVSRSQSARRNMPLDINYGKPRARARARVEYAWIMSLSECKPRAAERTRT